MGPTCSIVYENEPIEKDAMQRPPSAYRYISELERAYGKYYSGIGYHSRNTMDVSIFCYLGNDEPKQELWCSVL
jgi:Ca2+-transporting ATPase